MTREDMLALADRVESLDREVDLLIHAYLTSKKWRWAEFGGAFGKITDPQIAVEVKPWEGTEHEHKFYWDRPDVELVPAYTASLDAAMSLYVEIPDMIPSSPRKATADALRQRAEAL